MISDISVKLAILAAAAWLLTRRSAHAEAAVAHRLWVAVLLGPLALVALNAFVPPLAVVTPKAGSITSGALRGVGEWWRVLAGVYLCVAGLLLVRVMTGLQAVRKLVAGSHAVPDSELRRLRGLAQSPRLRIREASLRVPVTAGVWRSTVILPQGWREMPEAALTAILLHEAAHVRRRDCLVAGIGAVAEALLWFHPAVWLATSRVRWFAELACDAHASDAMDRRRYAEVLLDLAATWANASRPRYAITAGAETWVAQRIRSLIDAPLGSRTPRRVLWRAAVIAVTFGLVVSGSVRFSATGSAGTSASVMDDGWHAAAHRLQHGH